MKYRRLLTFLILIIILFSSIIPIVSSQSEGDSLLDQIIGNFLYRSSTGPVKFLWPWGAKIRQEIPETFSAIPNTIDIEYLDYVEVKIGMVNPDTGELVNWESFEPDPFFKAVDYEYSLEVITEGIPQNALTLRFEPDIVRQAEEGDIATTLFIESHIPKHVGLPSGIIVRVNVTRWVTAGNLFLPRPEERFPVINFLHFLSSIGIPTGYPFGLWYSGKRTPDVTVSVDILLRLNRFHFADILNPPQNVEMRPNQVLSIPIEIENRGSHLDTFNFNIKTNSDDLIVSQPNALTIEPGEIGYTTFGVASPRYFQDPGTVHSISIEAYSIYQPEKVFTNTITVTTRGVYISELNTSFFIFLSIIIIFGAGFLLYRRKRKLDELLMKPDKPWDLPEEKEYLKELKEKDKKKYKETLAMLDQEYQSSILWYNSYIISVLHKEKIKKQKPKLKESKIIKSIKNLSLKPKKSRKPEKKEKIKAKEKGEKKEKQNKLTKAFTKLSLKPKETKKSEIEKEEIEEPKLSEAEIEAAISERKKQEALLKTRRLQEKQKRKYRSAL